MKKCESCGKVFAENKDVFCPHCGAVAEKKCTHGSSFDSSRWNRGEIYGNDNTNTYRGGVEPHVQRTEENGENRQAKRSLDPTIPFDGKAVKKIIGIVVIIIVCINLIVGFSNFVLTEDDWADVQWADDWADEQWVESVPSGEFEYSPTIGNAQVEVENVGADWFVFKLKVDDFYFHNIDEEGSKEISADLFNYEQYAEIEASVFYETEMYRYEYESELENYTYLSSLADPADGYYEFYDYEFQSGDIIYLRNFYIGTENSSLYPELPFDAFSCDDDGDVTYYRVSEEQNDGDTVVIEECAPSAAVDSYDVYVSLENREVEFFENTEVTENYTEVVSVVG